MLRVRDSMDSFNSRGCDEIMCQFIKDLDTSFDNSAVGVESEEENLHNNHSSVNLEIIIK